MTRRVIGTLSVVLALAACGQNAPDKPAAAPAAALTRPSPDTAFGALIESLSEPGGFFDSDNLVSNEPSYLTVLGKMAEMKVQGGAYLGVGPDQSFSYIAQVRPKIAFMIDIRRDNLLQHLLYKALFEMSRTRVEYLALLFGRDVPRELDRWTRRPLPALLAYIDSMPPREELLAVTKQTVARRVQRFGIPLDAQDLASIDRMQSAFFREGLDIRYTSLGRPSRPGYPTYRDLLLERDLAGHQANYFASEDEWQFLKRMQDASLIVPVTGNLAGAKALEAIAGYMAEHDLKVSAFYVSNVESYLMRDGLFDGFAENVSHLPIDEHSVIIRSYFGGRGPYASAYPVTGTYYGFGTVQILQTLDSFVREWQAGGYQTYLDVVTKHAIELQ
jgi:hypothetical protein